eukprot:gene15305-20622_t
MTKEQRHQQYENHTGTQNATYISNKLAVISVILSLFGTLLLLSHTGSIGSSSINKSALSSTTAPSTELNANSVISTNKKLINFSINRVGYSLLPYFDNSYDSKLTYAFLKSYDGIVEPDAPMELSLYDGMVVGHKYIAYITKNENNKNDESNEITTIYLSKNEHYAQSFKVSCIPHETFTIKIKQIDSDNNLINELQSNLICMSVRREIRSLTSEDLTSFITASHKLWEYSDEEGEKLYGTNFKSNSYLLKFHYFNAALQDQDHIHEGNGFLIQHVKMTNIFDASVRSVDPSAALPYWDFTIDSETSSSTLADSFVMRNELYGSTSKPKDFQAGFVYGKDLVNDARIPDSLWANLKTEFNTEYSDLKFGYGYMRAPWNLNPSPYISRFVFDFSSVKPPSCMNHYKMLSEYDDLMTFFFKMAFGPHASIHGLLGGMYGCDMFQPLIDSGHIFDSSGAEQLCSIWFVFIKEFYRYGYLTPRSDCKINENNVEDSECGFICNPETYSEMLTKLFSLQSKHIDTSKSDAEDVWKEFICTGNGAKIFAGDHLESASPADPSFWVVHPTLERLLQAKFMSGGFATEKWTTNPKTEYVCDKPKCYDSVTGVRDYYDYCCYGHFEDSRLLNAITGDRFSYFGPTNGEVLKSVDPRREDYSAPYIYDQFSWSHCSDDFVGLLEGNDLTKANTNSESSSSSTAKSSSNTAVSNDLLSSPM